MKAWITGFLFCKPPNFFWNFSPGFQMGRERYLFQILICRETLILIKMCGIGCNIELQAAGGIVGISIVIENWFICWNMWNCFLEVVKWILRRILFKSMEMSIEIKDRFWQIWCQRNIRSRSIRKFIYSQLKMIDFGEK